MIQQLAGIDYTGEWFAEVLGITTPRYQYVIDEVIRVQEQVNLLFHMRCVWMK